MNTIQSGNRTQLTGAIAINKMLESNFYDIGHDPMSGYYLEHRPAFAMPEKIYGDCNKFTDRVIKTFSQLKKGMSVLLSGPKGCGKTMTAKKICLNSCMPVICVSAPHCGEGFKTFLTNIPNPCVVFIDEFEKTYQEEDHRNYMLSLLDGSTHNKHLFILTSNSENIGEYFKNRPGRVRYHKKFDEFPVEALHEMIDDKVTNTRIKKALHQYVEESGAMSPDMMSCLIEECLIHNQAPKEFKEYFNINSVDNSLYDCVIEFDKLVPNAELSNEDAEKAYNYINYTKSSDETKQRIISKIKDIESYKKLCTSTHVVYRNQFCRPFENFDDDNELNFNSMFCAEEKEYDSFYVRGQSIKSIKKENGVIVIKWNNYTATLRKSKSKIFSL